MTPKNLAVIIVPRNNQGKQSESGKTDPSFSLVLKINLTKENEKGRPLGRPFS